MELKKIIETLLFITDEPLRTEKIARICEIKDSKRVEEKLEELKYQYDMENRALSVMKIAGGWQMSTRNEYSLWIRKLYQTRLTLRLSNAGLETLSIIAYRQPITRAEIEAIRGVDVIGPLETLIERKLITVVGRKETVGRPILYGTTEEFLRQFGLNSLEDLPKLDTVVSRESIDVIDGKIKAQNAEDPASAPQLFEQSVPRPEKAEEKAGRNSASGAPDAVPLPIAREDGSHADGQAENGEKN
ncbi:MAG: SMC-Scp complex subunit ScpB [Elusimicrobia bacterium CG08_land_8_20_14_0_20_51_18]|nr:MAG: SMC-Scp complex subunit ScpB [Elusimicrobia bacterium CG08_land_8_20_14_0_20_51_18]